jgi:8-oxo-dGTP pyrophosphatase MutT (NUDIX family)
MLREISAGGVVVRRMPGGWELAVIEPQREAASNQKVAVTDKKRPKQVLALPKGLLDPGEKADQAAVREVQEETGITGAILAKLIDIRYVYVRAWSDQQQVFKIVSFYLLRYESGEIDDVSEEMRVEVKRALWIPLEGAERKLAYRGERDAIKKAREYLQARSQEAS